MTTAPANTERAEGLRLVGLNAELHGVETMLVHGLTIGRSVQCTLFLPDPNLRHRHCLLEQHPTGVRIVCGRQADQIRINSRWANQADLRSGDRLEIGRFRFRIASASVEAQPPVVALPLPQSRSVQRWEVLAAQIHDRDPRRLADFITAWLAAPIAGVGWRQGDRVFVAQRLDDGEFPPRPPLTSVAVRLLQRSLTAPGADRRWIRCGIGQGQLHCADGQWWGSACERAAGAARRARALQICDSLGKTYWAVEDDAVGRRQRWRLVWPIRLQIDGRLFPAWGLQLQIDPENATAKLTLISHAAVEPMESVIIGLPTGRSLPAVGVTHRMLPTGEQNQSVVQLGSVAELSTLLREQSLHPLSAPVRSAA